MSISQEQQEIIEKYLRQELSEVDQSKFTAYRQDAEFQEELKIWMDLQQVFKIHGRQRLKDQLRTRERQLIQRQSRRPNIYRYIAIAAAILVLATFIFLMPQTTNYEKRLFDAHFEPYPSILKPTTRGDVQKSEEQDPYFLYESEAYVQADVGFVGLAKTDTVQFYRSMIQLEFENYQTAISILEALDLPMTSSLFDASIWYLGLAYLGNGDLLRANSKFHQIKEDPDHPYHGEAIRILKELALQ